MWLSDMRWLPIGSIQHEPGPSIGVHDLSATADIIRGGGWARAESESLGLFARAVPTLRCPLAGTEARYSLALRALLRSGRSFWRGDRPGRSPKDLCARHGAEIVAEPTCLAVAGGGGAQGNQAANIGMRWR